MAYNFHQNNPLINRVEIFTLEAYFWCLKFTAPVAHGVSIYTEVEVIMNGTKSHFHRPRRSRFLCTHGFCFCRGGRGVKFVMCPSSCCLIKQLAKSSPLNDCAIIETRISWNFFYMRQQLLFTLSRTSFEEHRSECI